MQEQDNNFQSSITPTGNWCVTSKTLSTYPSSEDPFTTYVHTGYLAKPSSKRTKKTFKIDLQNERNSHSAMQAMVRDEMGYDSYAIERGENVFVDKMTDVNSVQPVSLELLENEHCGNMGPLEQMPYKGITLSLNEGYVDYGHGTSEGSRTRRMSKNDEYGRSVNGIEDNPGLAGDVTIASGEKGVKFKKTRKIKNIHHKLTLFDNRAAFFSATNN